MKKKTAIIIGAGPAGLTAAYELLKKTDIHPIIIEMSDEIGGISRTVNYKGNRIDIGGHRFFSKSDRVMNWWENIIPVQGAPSSDDIILNRQLEFSDKKDAPDPEKSDRVLLIRSRLSRIFYLRKFFDYPISLSVKTLQNLGLVKVFLIGVGYIYAQLFPIRKEETLEHFFINRFGKFLYGTFFKDYTEKVWGVPCKEIPSEWGAQRIKGLSITKAVVHALKKVFTSKKKDVSQKDTETSLIERFWYPKLGPGQMWEIAAQEVEKMGGEIRMKTKVSGLKLEQKNLSEVTIISEDKSETISGDYIFSSMPIKDLFNALDGNVPSDVNKIATSLQYRDFITVGLLCKDLNIKNETKHPSVNNIVPDNWIYIQERDVKVGRLQIFNNWSPYMVKDTKNSWIGLEYFCNEGDELWSMKDKDFTEFGIKELEKIDIIDSNKVIDSTIIRQPKAYPAYFGNYDKFGEVQKFMNTIENLFPIGRNGMHRYNNQDHSMLSAMTAVENIINNIKTKDNLWEVNAEKEYHEKK